MILYFHNVYKKYYIYIYRMLTNIQMRIAILEIYEELVKKGIWNEKMYLDEVNNIKNIKDKDLEDVLFYLKNTDDY